MSSGAPAAWPMLVALLPWLAALYGVASAICFLAYAIDKQAAKRGARRTPERTLLLIGLACGWPGGWAAQRWLRHKSSKTSFLLKFWLCAALNLIALAALAGLAMRLSQA